jgi:hypothetical protein
MSCVSARGCRRVSQRDEGGVGAFIGTPSQRKRRGRRACHEGAHDGVDRQEAEQVAHARVARRGGRERRRRALLGSRLAPRRRALHHRRRQQVPGSESLQRLAHALRLVQDDQVALRRRLKRLAQRRRSQRGAHAQHGANHVVQRRSRHD